MNTNPHNLEILKLCNIIRQTSFEIHRYLRAGHRELIYENALAHRLRKKGIAVEQQQKVKVFDEDGTLLGFFKTDLMIEDRLILEIKGVRELTDEHIAQLLGYLRASRIEHGLLINFGAARLEVKKYILN
jgi:GxxExxY protein